MGQTPRIAIDAMGGDGGPAVILAGAARALRLEPDLSFLLYGDEAQVRAALAEHPMLERASRIVHAPDLITGSDKPSQAIRRAKTTSMGLAIAAVKAGDAGAAVSAGNTGALMAMSKLALRMMPGIHRPALAALLPSLGANDIVMLDLGANTECDTENLIQFAVMGAAYARVAMGLTRPKVALLNIGTEDLKGTDELRDAAAALRSADYLSLEFSGFIEGDRVSRGDVDVIVSDGFSGNIALKTAEGTARFVTDLLRRVMSSATSLAATPIALATPCASAPPWLFTTMPFSPRKTAPLCWLGSRWWRSSSVAGREIRNPTFERNEEEKARRSRSVNSEVRA